MAEYKVSMDMTVHVDELYIDADSETDAVRIARDLDIDALIDLGADLIVDEMYDINTYSLEDPDAFIVTDPAEMDDILDELIAIERDNFIEDEEFDDIAEDFEEFEEYMNDAGIYSTSDIRSLWTKFNKALNDIVKEYTAIADEDDD